MPVLSNEAEEAHPADELDLSGLDRIDERKSIAARLDHEDEHGTDESMKALEASLPDNLLRSKYGIIVHCEICHLPIFEDDYYFVLHEEEDEYLLHDAYLALRKMAGI